MFNLYNHDYYFLFFITNKLFCSGYIKELHEKFVIKYTLVDRNDYDLSGIYSIIKLKINGDNINIIFLNNNDYNIFGFVNKFDFSYCKIIYSFKKNLLYMHQDFFDFCYYFNDNEREINSLGNYLYSLSYQDMLESKKKLIAFETFFFMEKRLVAKRIFKYILKGCIPLNDCVTHILKWGEINYIDYI
jgi:hypothetical protein